MGTQRLTFIRRVTTLGAPIHRALYACVCGNEVEAREYSVRVGEIVSCGCYRREKTAEMGRKTAKHGHSRAGSANSAYVAWQQMKYRCGNASSKAYAGYGGRGITVCERWLCSFENFLVDMGECPIGKSLDRIDNDGNYEPGNCRWATSREQVNNRRNTFKFDMNGRVLTLREAMKETECRIGLSTVRRRIIKGIPPLLALTTPAPRGNRYRSSGDL